MNFEDYFFAYFFWLIFNRTELFSLLRKKYLNFLLLIENKVFIVYPIRYITTICASCFCFWCNLIPSMAYGSIKDLVLFFVLTFSYESIYSALSSNKKI